MREFRPNVRGMKEISWVENTRVFLFRDAIISNKWESKMASLGGILLPWKISKGIWPSG